MTALGGFVSTESDDTALNACVAIVSEQSPFASSPPKFVTADGAAVGAALRPLLPTDRSSFAAIGDDRFLLVADVRLDNRDEIAGLCGVDGRRDLVTDSQVLLAAWNRWQSACLGRLVGDFALAVFDRGDRSMTLARDITGQRPLFYAQTRNGFALASMASGVCAADPRLRGWNMAHLAEALANWDSDSAESYFAGVSRVIPGELVRFSDGAVSRRRFWELPSGERRELSFPDAVEQYRELLARSVGCRMRRRSGLVAVHLSSGYDSSAVAATAAMESRDEQILAFTSAPAPGFVGDVPRGRFADESALAALTAQKHGMRHEVVHSPELTIEHLRQQARLYQEPVSNIINSLWAGEILHRAKAEGATVLLNGAIGNSTLNAAGLQFLPDWLRQRGPLEWWRQARAAAARDDVRWRGVLFTSLSPWLTPAFASMLTRRFLGIDSAANNSFLRPEWARHGSDLRRRIAFSSVSSTAANRLQIIQARDPGTIYKGALAESGIWQMDPLADRRIVEFSLSFPPEHLIHDGEYRPVARAALSDRLPAEVLDSTKRGVQSADWQRVFTKETAFAVVEEIEASAVARDLLDTSAIRAAIARWPRNGSAEMRTLVDYASSLPAALATGIFLKEFEWKWCNCPPAASADARLVSRG